MTIYEVNGQKSLCPFCVTLDVGYMLKHRGHSGDCPITKMIERYLNDTPRDAGEIFREIFDSIFTDEAEATA